MMKRPRSFISTLLFVLALVATAAPGSYTPVAHAGGLPRVMDPRAGDPTEPDDGPLPNDSQTQVPDPETRVQPLPRPGSAWYERVHAFLYLVRTSLHGLFGGQ